jgi:wyosine [tRNA(Phe)-imidazoG37] synthetase (radical SAM superfamily)
MKFQTLSLVAGTQICNAKCPFCVSKLTSLEYVDKKPEEINHRNLNKAFRLAEIGNVTTVIITGKGEPTLYPEHIDTYLSMIGDYNFPFIELQTNGLILELDTYKDRDIDEMLESWACWGLTTILISNVGYDYELNRSIYFPHKKQWINIQKVVDKIHKHGINVRLTTVGIDKGIDSPEKIKKLVEWADFLNVKQLTWRPVNKPQEHSDDEVANWVEEGGLSVEQVKNIRNYVEQNGKLLYNLVHGAAVYDLHGKNFCLSNCLTHDPMEETVRQLIFYPDGSLYTDWVHKGSVLL